MGVLGMESPFLGTLLLQKPKIRRIGARFENTFFFKKGHRIKGAGVRTSPWIRPCFRVQTIDEFVRCCTMRPSEEWKIEGVTDDKWWIEPTMAKVYGGVVT